MSKKRVTREDVAKLAGVSTATVSYVLNKSIKVKPSTQEKVLSAVKELDYRPDPIARSMVTKQTMQLSIVLNNIANPIYSDMILGFEKQALEKGYFVNICTGQSNIDEYFDDFVSRRIDGVFIEALPEKYHIEKVYKLVDAGIKVIMFGHGGVDLRKVSSVENDYIYTLEKAVEHLWGLGHREIAYLSGLSEDQGYDLRVQGYKKAMERLTASTSHELCLCSPGVTNTDIADGRRMAHSLLESGKPFSAVITTNDLMAIGAMQQFQESGFSVPDDVSVLGIDGASFGEIVTPRLTTMKSDYYQIGAKAFELLFNSIKEDTKGFYQNHPHLVVRGSTAKKRER
ncbi:MAG: LacI family DNA-binding transcriptional regulator [Sphaerochaeta sp.]|nr:LacI family DNA-binding transcriptional regulator [Sphaerochaeta sp.]